MKKCLGFLFMLIYGCFLLTGCCSQTAKADNLKSYEVIDTKGNVVKMQGKPMHIVSLTLGTDAILMDLVSPERIAGLTYLSDDPGISHISERSKQVKGKIRGNNAEAILALNPDLVIIADWWDSKVATTLRDMGIPVYVYKTPYSLKDVRTSIKEVATLVGEQGKGAEIIRKFDEKLQTVETTVEKIPVSEQKNVIALVPHGGFGAKGSMFNDMCKFAHARNLIGDLEPQLAQTLSKEQLVVMNPDAFIIPTWDGGGMMKAETKKELLQDESLATTNAIRNKDIVEVPGGCVYTVSQYVADGVEILAAGIYPKYFKD